MSSIKADISPGTCTQAQTNQFSLFLLNLLTASSSNVCITVTVPSIAFHCCVFGTAARPEVNPQGLFVYRVSESDEPGRLNITTETSCLHSQMGIPERETACQFHQRWDNPREETTFLLACVSLQRQNHQSNKSVMPLSFSLFEAFFHLQPCFSASGRQKSYLRTQVSSSRQKTQRQSTLVPLYPIALVLI